MPKKIGELLKESGLVTADQLDAALRAQLFYGGISALASWSSG